MTPLLLWVAPLMFLALFYFFPLASILELSFARSQEGFAAPFRDVWSSPRLRGVIGFTLEQAVLSTLLTLLLGLPAAYLLARYEFRGKSLLLALSGIPFVMPTLVVAAAFNALLGPRGWVNLGLMALFGLASPPIAFTNSLAAILVAHVFYNTTIVLRTVGDFWSHLDPRLEQAAQTLGASRWTTFRKITLPLLAPAISAAALLVFIFDFTSFGVILILGGPRFSTLEVEIYNQTVNLFNLPVAAALSIIQLACTLLLTVTYTWLSRRVSRPLSLRPRVFTARRLRTWRSRLWAGALITLLFTLLTLPLLALAARSVTRLEADRGQFGPVRRGLTLDFYKELNVNRRSSIFYAPPLTAIGVSLAYAGATVVLSLVLGIPASWALAQPGRAPAKARAASPLERALSSSRQNLLLPGQRLSLEGQTHSPPPKIPSRAVDSLSLANRLFDPLLMLPLGTSAVTLGLGFIVALDTPPFDLRASPLLVPLAHTLVAFPFVVRSLAPALRSIRPRLRHAAQVLGASPLQAFRLVDLPLAGRAILVAATYAFTISLGEFGATALIARPEYPTVPVAIYRFLSRPGALNYGQALALSTILMVVTAAGMLAIERFRIAEIGEF